MNGRGWFGAICVAAMLACTSFEAQAQVGRAAARTGQTPAPSGQTPARTAPGRTAPGHAPDSLIQQVEALLAREDWSGAGALTARSLRAYPDDPVLHNFAGVIDAQRNAAASAEEHFVTAIRLAPRLRAPYENLGRLYQEHEGEFPEARTKALATYTRLLEVEPANTEGLYQAAFLLAIDGHFRESQELIERLPADLRPRPQIAAVLAVDLDGTGDRTAAIAIVRRLADDPHLGAADVLAVLPAFDHLKDDEIPRMMLEALDGRGMASGESLAALARIHVRHQRYAEARRILERAVALDGPRVPLLIDLARTADKAGDHQGALGYLAHARDLDPSNPEVHFLFGIVCVELNLGSEAYESLKKAVALAPGDPRVNYAMGAVSMHRREPAESLPYFEKYAALAPSDPRGRFALGMARFYSGELEKAAADLREAAGHPETAAGAHYFLGRVARQANDLETARREVEASLKLQPGYADAWAELGLIQTRTGDYTAAERSLDQATKIDSDNYAAAANLAVLYGRTKDPRREAHAARLEALQQKRAEQAQEFLRIIEVVR